MWVKPTSNIIEVIKRGAPNTKYQNASLSCGSSASGDLFCSSLIIGRNYNKSLFFVKYLRVNLQISPFFKLGLSWNYLE